MKNLFRTYPALTLYRILLLYVVLMLCRAIFALYNFSALGGIELAELPRLIYGGLRFDTISICYAFGLWVLLSLLPLRSRTHKVYRGILFYYYVIVGAFCIAVNMSDAVYFRYTQKRFTADEFMFADNSNSAQLIFKFAAENLHLVVIGFALIALLVWGYRRKVTPVSLLKGWLYYPANTLVLCLALMLCVAGIRGGLSRMARPTAIPYSLKFAKTGDKANIVLSNPFCILRTIGSNRLEVPHYFDAEQLANIYTPYHLPKANGEFRPRNVVIFVIESMSAENSAFLAPDLYENSEQKGYTPFLDSLMQSGYAFKRMYANGKRSIQALPSIWGSIPSLVKPFMLMPQSLGESRPLPSLLRDKGYSTAFFCGSERGSMGFDAYAISAGFEQCFSKEDYEKAHGYNDFDGYWGIWDDKFISFMGETIDELPQPFLASIFTTTSHHPFVTPDEWKPRLPKGHTPMQPCAAYLDGAIERFFEENRDKEWFKDTIFAFVADHVSCEYYAERTHFSPGDFHIIGLLYAPDNSLRGECNVPVSQIDLMPTLLGVLSYDSPYFAYGRDIFEPAAAPMTIVYDNGLYKAFTAEYIHIFSDGAVREIYAISDATHANNLIESCYDPNVEISIKAFVQQYYDHANRKSYVVPEEYLSK